VHFKTLLFLSLSAVVYGDNNYEMQIAEKNIHYKEYGKKPSSTCQNKTVAFDIDTLSSKMNDTNTTIKKFNIQVTQPTQDAKLKASNLDKNVKSETTQANIDSMKEKILKDANYSFKGHEKDPWKKSYDSNKINSLNNPTVYKTSPVKEQILAPKERLFIVISSSMPDNIVKEYLRTVTENIRGHATVLMQGLVGGVVKMRPTVDYIKRVSENGTYVGVEVHPDIIKTYGVEKVPAVLYIKDFDPINDNGNGITVKSKEYQIVYGAVSLEGAVKEIYEKYPTKGLSKILSRLKGEGAGFYGHTKKQ